MSRISRVAGLMFFGMLGMLCAKILVSFLGNGVATIAFSVLLGFVLFQLHKVNDRITTRLSEIIVIAMSMRDQPHLALPGRDIFHLDELKIYRSMCRSDVEFVRGIGSAIRSLERRGYVGSAHYEPPVCQDSADLLCVLINSLDSSGRVYILTRKGRALAVSFV